MIDRTSSGAGSPAATVVPPRRVASRPSSRAAARTDRFDDRLAAATGGSTWIGARASGSSPRTRGSRPSSGWRARASPGRGRRRRSGSSAGEPGAMTALRPTPPSPKTTADEPGRGDAVLTTRPTPVSDGAARATAAAARSGLALDADQGRLRHDRGRRRGRGARGLRSAPLEGLPGASPTMPYPWHAWAELVSSAGVSDRIIRQVDSRTKVVPQGRCRPYRRGITSRSARRLDARRSRTDFAERRTDEESVRWRRGTASTWPQPDAGSMAEQHSWTSVAGDLGAEPSPTDRAVVGRAGGSTTGQGACPVSGPGLDGYSASAARARRYGITFDDPHAWQ